MSTLSPSRPVRTLSAPLGLTLVVAAIATLPACGGQPGARTPAPDHAACDASSAMELPPAMVAPAPIPAPVPPPGQTVRVGGDSAASITGTSGDYRSGPCAIDTPLPVGYPDPTPPGAIDVKTYPAVRLAQVAGSGNPDRGMNRSFWPLFNHIKKHDIAMTSPVEMTYSGLGTGGKSEPHAWSMAFLYRTPELNATGVEDSVTVRDASPVSVLAIGLRGDYSMALVERGRRTLQEWLDANPQWEPAGDWRALYYNGPSLFFWNKWAEVQVPVRPGAARS